MSDDAPSKKMNLPIPHSPDESPKPMAFRRADGLIELVHPYTGEVLSVQKDASASLEKTPDRYTPIQHGNEVHYLEKNLDAGVFGSTKKLWVRNSTIEDLICQMISAGERIDEICSTPGFPPLSVFGKWMKDDAEFKARVAEARALRAEVLKEQVLAQADQAIADASEDQIVQAHKLKVESLKWVASVDSPERFGNKTKVETSSTSTIMVIDTGIRRDAPEVQSGMKDVTKLSEEVIDVSVVKQIAQSGEDESR